MLTLKKARQTKEDAVPFTVYAGPDLSHRKEGDEDAIPITFYLGLLTGDDDQKIATESLQVTRKGARMDTGVANRAYVVRGVVGIEGLADESGNPIEKMTNEVYAALKLWMLNAVFKRLREVNEPSVDEEE